MHPLICQKSTFSHKMDQKWGVYRRVKGVRFKKSTLWVQRSTFWGPATTPPPPIDPGYGPGVMCTCGNLVRTSPVLYYFWVRQGQNVPIMHVFRWRLLWVWASQGHTPNRSFSAFSLKWELWFCTHKLNVSPYVIKRVHVPTCNPHTPFLF